MAEIKLTSYSHNAKASLHYLFYSKDNKFNKSHINNNGIHKRNEFIDGLNIVASKYPDIYRNSVRIYKYYLHQKPNQKIQAINSVISFSPNDINFINPDGSRNWRDIYIADRLVSAWVKKSFGKNRISLMFFQNDNRHEISHIHVCTLPLSIKPADKLRSLSGKQLNIYRLRRIGNQIEHQWNSLHPNHQLTSINEIHHNNIKRYQNGKFVKAPVIEARLIRTIKPILLLSTSRADLRHRLAKINIKMTTPRRKSNNHRAILFKSPHSHGYIRCSYLAYYDKTFRYTNLNQILHNNKKGYQYIMFKNGKYLNKNRFMNKVKYEAIKRVQRHNRNQANVTRIKNNNGRSVHRPTHTKMDTAPTVLHHLSFHLNNQMLNRMRRAKHQRNKRISLNTFSFGNEVDRLKYILNHTDANSIKHQRALIKLRLIQHRLGRDIER